MSLELRALCAAVAMMLPALASCPSQQAKTSATPVATGATGTTTAGAALPGATGPRATVTGKTAPTGSVTGRPSPGGTATGRTGPGEAGTGPSVRPTDYPLPPSGRLPRTPDEFRNQVRQFIDSQPVPADAADEVRVVLSNAIKHGLPPGMNFDAMSARCGRGGCYADVVFRMPADMELFNKQVVTRRNGVEAPIHSWKEGIGRAHAQPVSGGQSVMLFAFRRRSW